MPTIIDNSGKKQAEKFLVGRVYKRDTNSNTDVPWLCVNVASPGADVMPMLISLKDGRRWSHNVPPSTADWSELDCVITVSNKQT